MQNNHVFKTTYIVFDALNDLFGQIFHPRSALFQKTLKTVLYLI